MNSHTNCNPHHNVLSSGGRDFNTPLSVQKVTEKSIAKRSGLKEGDAILLIGKTKTDGFDHEQAKMEIIRNGNELEFVGTYSYTLCTVLTRLCDACF